MTRTIEEAWRQSQAHGSNFDALRLGAAALVIVSHSFEIVGGAPESEPFRVLTAGDSSLGRVAVMTFFVLSGFLLTRSFRAEPSIVRFVWKRALRIYPALIAVVLASVFLIGPLTTTMAPAAYFGSAETWRHLAALGFYTGFETLPGVFSATPVAGVVNGPLWTLKFEVLCYATLAALGAVRALRPSGAAAVVVAGYLASAAIGEGPHGGALYYLDHFADLARPFFVGALFALVGKRIALNPLIALFAVAGLIAAAFAARFSDAFPIFGGYLALYLAFAPLGPVARVGRFGDFSYGLYLWGWPAQQLIAANFGATGWLLNAALALPLALGGAVLSWALIEKPALALKSRDPMKVLKTWRSAAKGFAGPARSR